MAEPQQHVWLFTNRYGEAWEFRYDPKKREGVLRGSDIDWQSYRVIGGHAPGLILNDEEIYWLRRAWSEAASGAME